jgi:hypothetical protein
METILEFEHQYEVEQLGPTSGLPSKERKLFYPGASDTGGKDGVLVRISLAAGDAWIGSFAPGHSGSRTMSRVMSCPNPSEVCVISAGQGYIVRVENPSKWRSIRAIPVCDARAVLNKQLMLFSDFTKLVAYGVDGPQWESPSVSSDGIQITDIANGRVELVGWSAAKQRKEHVSVNLDDGLILSRTVE